MRNLRQISIVLQFESQPCELYRTVRSLPVPKQYLGHLSSRDALHPFLVHDVLPQMGVRNSAAEFRVFSMKASKVYLYEERHSSAQIVGKFFVTGGHHAGEGAQRMFQEFDNLRRLRGYGLAGYPHHVVRPLGTNTWLNSILVEEYAKGVPLSAFVGSGHPASGTIPAAVRQVNRPGLLPGHPAQPHRGGVGRGFSPGLRLSGPAGPEAPD